MPIHEISVVFAEISLDSLHIVCPGTSKYPLDEKIHVIGLARLVEEARASKVS